jgi:pimeloyl-ACP methyl ester carboxylesterase
MSELFAGLSGRRGTTERRIDADHPLVVALHGGTYTSAYFDLPGYSLIRRAEALGVAILAPDRPGYGESPALALEKMTLQGNADALAPAIGEAWDRYRGDAKGVVLIGHSIGGAIAMMIAAQTRDWPLLGLAVSGIGLRSPPHTRDAWASLPDLPMVDLPSAVKDQVMFGPAGSYTPDMPAASHAADHAIPRSEILDIVSTWDDAVHGIAASIAVPLHYRQAEHDALWIVSEDEVSRFSDAHTASPHKDAAMVPGVGHCMDFHRYGAAMQVQQLGFALQCASMVRPR